MKKLSIACKGLQDSLLDFANHKPLKQPVKKPVPKKTDIKKEEGDETSSNPDLKKLVKEENIDQLNNEMEIEKEK